MKAPLIAATMIVAPLISQCWIVAQELKFIEEHHLQRVKVSCYIAGEGAHTADGSVPIEGMVSSNKEHLGMDMILYTNDLVAEARFQCTDVGGHPMLQNGTAVDFYRNDIGRCWDFVNTHSAYVWVEWIEREEDDNVDQYQTDGHATQTPAED